MTYRGKPCVIKMDSLDPDYCYIQVEGEHLWRQVLRANLQG